VDGKRSVAKNMITATLSDLESQQLDEVNNYVFRVALLNVLSIDNSSNNPLRVTTSRSTSSHF
jgi:hypothetical protein